MSAETFQVLDQLFLASGLSHIKRRPSIRGFDIDVRAVIQEYIDDPPMLVLDGQVQGRRTEIAQDIGIGSRLQ